MKSEKMKRYSIRKLSVGIVSVVIGQFYIGRIETPVVADEVKITTIAENSTSESASKISNKNSNVKEENNLSTTLEQQNHKELKLQENSHKNIGESSTQEVREEGIQLPKNKFEEENKQLLRKKRSVTIDETPTSIASEELSVTQSTPHYLVTDKNYYNDPSINLGETLTKKVKDLVNANQFTRLKTTYGDDFSEDITVLEFWKKFGYSPEDRYSYHHKVTDKRGNAANATQKTGQQTTFELPYEIIYYQKNGQKHAVKVPNLFSRLTVGEQPNIWKKVDKSWGSGWTRGSVSDLEVMKNLLGYGEDSTVDQYILDPANKNNFVIPTRYNTERNDVWLTMRGGSPDLYGSYLTGARAHLTATSASGKQMNEKSNIEKTSSDEFYINTTTKLGITEAGFDNLGERFLGGKSVVGSQKIFEKVNNGGTVESFWSSYTFQDLRNRLITHFMDDINANLENYEKQATGINLGVGGQIQLTGLYRMSDLDSATITTNNISNYNNYLSDEKTRLDESSHITNVEYYMYNSSNKEQLFSPAKSVFQIETTRPYFKSFGDLSTTVKLRKTTLDTEFVNKLGSNSFELEDKGITSSGVSIGVDKTHVRAMITENGEIKERNLSLDDLKASLNKSEYLNKELKIFYTYAALDTKGIDGKLPTEIATNQGAYAVPIVRTVQVLENIAKTEDRKVIRTIQYKDQDTQQLIQEAPTVTQEAIVTRTKLLDPLTNSILGYDTNNDGLVDTTDENQAWVVKEQTWVEVKSPIIENYNAPSKTKVDAVQITPTTKDVTEVIEYTQGTENIIENNTATRTIKYVDAADKTKEVADTVKQTATITRTNVRNKVTGVITEGKWSEANWKAVDSPIVKNYDAPSKAKVDVVQITPTTADVSEVIEYTQGTENKSESKTVTRTIKYVDVADKTKEVADTVTQKATITRTNVRNKVTGVITEGKWSEANWEAVDSPRVENYNAPSQTKVDVVQITPTTKDVTELIEYTQGTENIVESKTVTRTIKYVDAADKTKEVADTVKQIVTITRTNVRNKVTGVITEGKWSKANWEAVDSPRVENYNAPSQTKVDVVQITPTTADVTEVIEYTQGIENIVESKIVTRTIKYVDAADKTKEVANTVKQTATITRTNVRNKVTGVITEGKWSVANWEAVDSPIVKNYDAPSKAKVDAVQVTLTTIDTTVIVEYTKSKPVPQPQPEPRPEPVPQPKPEPRPEPVPQPKPEPRPELVPQLNPEPRPEPVPQPKSEPTPEPTPEPTLEPLLEHEIQKSELPKTGTGSEFEIFSAAVTAILVGLGLLDKNKRNYNK